MLIVETKNSLFSSCINLEIFNFVQQRNSRQNRIDEPSTEQWEQIAQNYNNDPNMKCNEDEKNITGEDAKQWLTECGNILFIHQFPQGYTLSLNQPIGDEQNSELGDMIENQRNLSPNDNALYRSLYEDFKESLQTIYDNPQLYKIDDRIQQIAQMYYVKGLTQIDISEKLFGISRNDPTSKRLSKFRETIAELLLEKYRDQSHNPVTSDDINIKVVSEKIKKFLRYYYDVEFLDDDKNNIE